MKFDYFHEGLRIPSLDGMRAIAIIIVIIAHALDTTTFVTRAQVYQFTGNLGPLGVRFFFLTSGFLITSILLREMGRTGTLSLKRFYLRRAFRIFPAFYCYLGIMLLMNWLCQLSIPWGDWLTAATYTINYRADRNWNLTHFWSLAVEEQFYLLWPVALLWFGRQRALAGAVLVMMIVPWLRYGTLMLFPGHSHGIPWEFHTVCDGLATGCVLAGFRDRLAASSIYRRIRTPIFAGVAFLAIWLVSALSYGRPQINTLIAPTLVNLAMAWLLDILMEHPRSIPGRLVNSTPMVFIGLLSYSLYLWQQPFLRDTSHILQSFPLNIGLAFLAALISYYLVERPFLRFRRRFEPGPLSVISQDGKRQEN